MSVGNVPMAVREEASASAEENNFSCVQQTMDRTDTALSSPLRSRDLSPVMDQVRGYIKDADELLEEVIERLVSNAGNAARSGVHQASEMVNRSRHAVLTRARHAQEVVHDKVHRASEIVHSGAEIMHTKVHQASELVHHRAEELVDKVKQTWKNCHFEKLPAWMKDNEHLHFGHRPELQSFAECFKSIFRIHTETGNIWTHLIGFVAFVIVTVVFYIKPLCATCQLDIDLSEKLIFLTFFIGAILCLACSTLFHTLCCHSQLVSAIFSRLDYAGIAFLIVGSIIPWLYYGFYCQFYTRITYITAVSLLGILTIVLTMLERFNTPDFRVWRTVTFVSLAGASTIPCLHHVAQVGFAAAFMEAYMQCTLAMAALYLTGALLYAARIPERFLPGKCDIWFQSHQIFHVLVIAGAFVHYYGISEMAMSRLRQGDKQCLTELDMKPIIATDPLLANEGVVYS